MKKKIISTIGCLLVAIGMYGATSHSFIGSGNNLTLIITGSGDMDNYSNPSTIPWYSQRENVTSVIVSNDVTSIGRYAFYGCNNLTSVSLPDGLISIGNYAFQSCANLISITIPSGIKSISSNAFSWCNNLTTINVASENQTYSSIGGVLFDKNKSTLIYLPQGITGNYIVPNGVTDISYLNNSNLVSITIPEGVISIGGFSGCSSLTSINIPASVTSIGYAGNAESSFSDCGNLTSIDVASENQNYSSVDGVLFNKNKTNLIRYPIGKTGNYVIPNGVVSIGWDAFMGCSGLYSVTIPNSVTSLGGSSFAFCENLTSIIIQNAIPPSVWRDTFSGVICGLIVPLGSAKTYRSLDVWEWFNISEYSSVITVLSNNPDLGNAISISGCSTLTTTTPDNTSANFIGKATLYALAKGGKLFVGWEDGNLENPREVTIENNTTFTALFADCETNTEVRSAKATSPLKVYPNPANSTLNVEVVDYVTNGTLTMFDLNGKLVLSQAINGNSAQINMSALCIGNYILRLVENGTASAGIQVIKQ